MDRTQPIQLTNRALVHLPGSMAHRASVIAESRTPLDCRSQTRCGPERLIRLKSAGHKRQSSPTNLGKPIMTQRLARALVRRRRRCRRCRTARSDRSSSTVYFDGILGEYVIDRKWGVRDAPHARAQLLRQSQVLAQHRLIGTWEVPTQVQMIKALKLLRKMNVTNIKVRVVKP